MPDPVEVTEPLKLTSFEGSPVVGAAIEIPNAGGGLNDAMKFSPVELHHGDEVYVVLKCVVGKIRFDPVKKAEEGELTRVHVFSALQATMVDGSLVMQHLEQAEERTRLAREAAEGVQRIPYDPAAYASPEDAHLAGEHASGLHPNCGECNSEHAAAEKEREDRLWGKPSVSVNGVEVPADTEIIIDPASTLPVGPGLHAVPDPEGTKPVAKKAKGK